MKNMKVSLLIALWVMESQDHLIVLICLYVSCMNIGAQLQPISSLRYKAYSVVLLPFLIWFGRGCQLMVPMMMIQID